MQIIFWPAFIIKLMFKVFNRFPIIADISFSFIANKCPTGDYIYIYIYIAMNVSLHQV